MTPKGRGRTPSSPQRSEGEPPRGVDGIGGRDPDTGGKEEGMGFEATDHRSPGTRPRRPHPAGRAPQRPSPVPATASQDADAHAHWRTSGSRCAITPTAPRRRPLEPQIDTPAGAFTSTPRRGTGSAQPPKARVEAIPPWPASALYTRKQVHHQARAAHQNAVCRPSHCRVDQPRQRIGGSRCRRHRSCPSLQLGAREPSFGSIVRSCLQQHSPIVRRVGVSIWGAL